MFKYNYTIKQEDLNAGNHVGNERALLYFQWVRDKFFKSHGLDEINIGNNCGTIQVEANVQYKKQLFLDQEIEIRITKIKIEGLKIIFEYEIYFEDNLCITGSTIILAYNYIEQKVKKVPAVFKEIVENFK